MEEQVLVIERSVIESEGTFHGLVFDVDRYLSKIFVQGIPRFIPRSQAEKDPSHKQIIPDLNLLEFQWISSRIYLYHKLPP